MKKNKLTIYVIIISTLFLVGFLTPLLQPVNGYVTKAIGYVKDQATNKGVSNVYVTVYGRYELNGRLYSFSRSGYTDTTGYYIISLPSTCVYYNRITTLKTYWSSYDGPKVDVIYIYWVGPPGTAAINGYVYTGSHGYVELPNAKVTVYDNSNNNIMGTDYTDEYGFYQITTSSFAGAKSVTIKITKESIGVYGTYNWLDTDYSAYTFTIYPFETYVRSFDVYDIYDIEKSITSSLLAADGETNFIFTTDYTITPNSLTMNPTITFNHWHLEFICTALISLSQYYFFIEGYTTLEFTEEYMIYDFEYLFLDVVRYQTYTLDGYPGVSNENQIIIADTAHLPVYSWWYVTWDNINGDYYYRYPWTISLTW